MYLASAEAVKKVVCPKCGETMKAFTVPKHVCSK